MDHQKACQNSLKLMLSRPRFRPACRGLRSSSAWPPIPGRSQGHSHAKDDGLAGFIPDRSPVLEARSRRGTRALPSPPCARRRRKSASIHVEPLGYLDPYPGVAKAAAPVAFKVHPDAVIEAFEVPFAFVMNAAKHAPRQEQIDGKSRRLHAMPYGARNIWGVTTGISRNLCERLYS